MQTDLMNIIKNLERYKTFTILDEPVEFNQLFKNDDFDVVQLYSAEIFEYKNGVKDIVGFCGVFEWKNNCIEPLDGDSYCDKFKVIGYEKFTNEEENVKNGLDVLVGEDW